MKAHFLYTEGGGFKPTKLANPEDVEFIIVDLFCGAGGTTTGFDRARWNGKKIAQVIACVNHDPKAIKSHWWNHPDVVHFEEDIRTLDLTGLINIVEVYRILYPNAKLILWASLECTNFSKAKGGQPRDADSRTLADTLHSIYDPVSKKYYPGASYIQLLNPDYIQIENVVEFMAWGPMRIATKKKHKGDPSKGVYPHTELRFCWNKKTNQEEYAWIPISKRNGEDFIRWRNIICGLGYKDEWKELNSANFGAYTSRNRLFGCFAKPGLPIVWPAPTHAKNPEEAGLFGGLEKWKAVKEVLDFQDEGLSMFSRKEHRKKDLVDKTLERIYAGLIKYVAGGKDNFILKYNSVSKNGKHVPPSTDDPCPTVAVQNRLGLCFIAKHFSGKPEGKVIPVTWPAGTITTSANQSIIKVSFIAKYYGNGDNISSIEEPAGTVTTKDRMVKVQTVWMDQQYGQSKCRSVEEPAGTITPTPKVNKVSAEWIDRNFSGGGQHSSIDAPAGSIPTVPKMNKVKAVPFLMNHNYDNGAKSIDQPAPTLMASRKHYYIVNPSHGGYTTSAEAPCPVIIARQDKAPLYVLQVEEAPACIPVYDDDPEIMVKIKVFMALYGIGDIKMRMLKISELLPIQGFPRDYKLYGNQSDQKKFIGNSVVPHVVKSWCEAMAGACRELRKEAA